VARRGLTEAPGRPSIQFVTARAEDGPARRMTVEEAWRAKLRDAAAGDGVKAQPAVSGKIDASAPGTAGGAAQRSEPPITDVPGAPHDRDASSPAAGRGGPPPPVIVVPERVAPPRPAPRARPSITPGTRPPARPRIEPEPAILGLSRHTRSRLGSRLFNLFFVFVFALIVIQMVVALLAP
jgi:hypothetical protein